MATPGNSAELVPRTGICERRQRQRPLHLAVHATADILRRAGTHTAISNLPFQPGFHDRRSELSERAERRGLGGSS